MDYQKAILDKDATSKKIRSLIAKSAFTHERLAELLQLNSPRVIYDWQSGKKMPNVENLFNLALIFNMKMEDLLIMK